MTYRSLEPLISGPGHKPLPIKLLYKNVSNNKSNESTNDLNIVLANV